MPPRPLPDEEIISNFRREVKPNPPDQARLARAETGASCAAWLALTVGPPPVGYEALLPAPPVMPTRDYTKVRSGLFFCGVNGGVANVRTVDTHSHQPKTQCA